MAPKPKKATPSGKSGDNPSRKTISPSVTVLGKKITRVPESKSYRAPFSAAQMKELKVIIAQAETAKMAKSPKAAAKEAKLIKDANKKRLVTGRGATKPVTKESIGTKKKPVIAVKPPRGGRGLRGGGLSGGPFGTRIR